MQQVEQRYLKIRQAAIYTGLSEKTLYRLAERDEIPAHKIGRIWRFDRMEVDAFMHVENL